MFSVLNSVGRTLVASDSLKITDSWVDICCRTIFNSNGDIISGPANFLGFSCERRISISWGGGEGGGGAVRQSNHILRCNSKITDVFTSFLQS